MSTEYIKALIENEENISKEVNKMINLFAEKLDVKKKSKLLYSLENVQGKYAQILISSIKNLNDKEALKIELTSEIENELEINKRIDEVVELNLTFIPEKEQLKVKSNILAFEKVIEEIRLKNY